MKIHKKKESRGDMLGEFIGSLFIVFTMLMWLDLILTFISKTFNKMLIKSLEEQNYLIDKRRKKIKLIFSKMFKD